MSSYDHFKNCLKYCDLYSSSTEILWVCVGGRQRDSLGSSRLLSEVALEERKAILFIVIEISPKNMTYVDPWIPKVEISRHTWKELSPSQVNSELFDGPELSHSWPHWVSSSKWSPHAQEPFPKPHPHLGKTSSPLTTIPAADFNQGLTG